MRPIHLVHLDKTRPAVILTREAGRAGLHKWTVAPVTSRVRGWSSEFAVGPANGLDEGSVVNCDHLETVPVSRIGRCVGYLSASQEAELAQALINAFDLAVEEL